MEYREKTALGKTERRDPYTGKRVHGIQGEDSLRENREKRSLCRKKSASWNTGRRQPRENREKSFLRNTGKKHILIEYRQKTGY
jgi:hypothetical protein